ncbi:MAG: hypothetical protein LBP60_07120 [Spirochaetaceae bacterium]|nr:hypothetical protein [Spirochaetaceae bacterium]
MCWYCGEPVTEPDPIGRSARCSCGKDLRSCRGCRFYLPGSRGDCSESGADPVSDKERGNFCDWFSLDPRFRSGTEGEQKDRKTREKSVAGFNKLFS